MTYEEILGRMQEKYRELTGFDADSASDIGIRLRVLAEQVAALYGRVETLGRQAFPQTSTGYALERHAECRGLFRKAALAAEGILRFSRETPATADIPIAAGVICATRPEPQLQFMTTRDAVLPAGERSVEVPARATLAGESGNVAPDAVCLMVSAATGITSVANAAPFAGGVDEEADDALRARLLDAYRNISNGTNAAFYYDTAMQNEAVASAAVLPRARGRGTVDVAVHCAAGEEAAIEQLRDILAARKEVNVDVGVYAAAERPVDAAIRVAPEEGADWDAVAAACGAAARRYVETLGVGHPLLLARLTGSLLALEGVYNVAVTAPAGDVHPAADAILRPGAIDVERMVVG